MHAMQIETFSKSRLISSPLLLLLISTVMANAQWTRNTTGCQCWFDSTSIDCACCYPGGCQCSSSDRHQCDQCGHGEQCGKPFPNYSWTRNTTGCKCWFDSGSTDCACCYPDGCPCSHSHRHQCVQCGYGGHCGTLMANAAWTRATTGCKCWFDGASTDCACCYPGGCPCSLADRHQCVQCDHGDQCGKPFPNYSWTRNTTGCQCWFDSGSTDCACCNSGGCPCSHSHRHQCVQCGYGGHCGLLIPNYQWTQNATGCTCLFDSTQTECACCYPGGCQCPRIDRHRCVQCGFGTQCGTEITDEEKVIAIQTYWEQLMNYHNDNTENVILRITYETGTKNRQSDSKTLVGTHNVGGSISIGDFFEIVSLELSYSFTHESTSSVMSENEVYETQTIETTVTIPPRSTLTRWQLFADVAGTKIGCSHYIDVLNDTDSTPNSYKRTGSAKILLRQQ